ncbi:MAG: methylmalonic aciduria and homocystinuria type D protein [Elainellaceae cyanobacterium]
MLPRSEVVLRGRRGLDEGAGAIEWSVHLPTPYISRRWPQLLPGWQTPIGSVLLLLQRAPLPLIAPSQRVEASKTQLRDRALSLGCRTAAMLRQQGYQAAIFDPKTGIPLAQESGIPLDDVAVVQALLGYRVVRGGGCGCIFHPSWGAAVYPTTLLCTATPSQVGAHLKELDFFDDFGGLPWCP